MKYSRTANWIMFIFCATVALAIDHYAPRTFNWGAACAVFLFASLGHALNLFMQRKER